MTKVLFIVDGRSGSGKSSIQEYLQNTRPDVYVVPRFSTRAHEDKAAHGDFIDKCTITEEEFDERANMPGFFWYPFGKHRYGFCLRHLMSDSAPTFAFLIVRDLNLIARLKVLGVAAAIPVIAVYLRASEKDCRWHLACSGHNDEEIARRTERDCQLYPDSRESSPTYDVVLDNSRDVVCLHESFIDLTLACATALGHGWHRASAGIARWGCRET